MSDEWIGTVIGGYDILERIGVGGMATVYLARQQSMDRHVAVKVLPKQYLKDDTYLQRFEREVSIASKLEHRNIIPVYDYGEHEGQPYIVMRYMPAGSLDDRIQKGPLAPNDMLVIIEQIAPALDYAHSKNVLHRDLKPSNVLMDDGGGAFITDFGIARVVGEVGVNITTQGVVGTPSYMSPEQAQGKELDGRSDVYSLGVLLFEMATGRRPFESDTAYSIAVMHVTTPPPAPHSLNPALSSAIEIVILKALKKGREERYQTAQALAEALKMAIERPQNVHDTEPRLKRSEAIVYATPVNPPARNYNTPSNAASRPVVPPPSSLRSQIRQRRRQNPLLNIMIGGTIGCGLLGIIIAVGFLSLSFLLPTAPANTPMPEADTTQTSTVTSLSPINTPTLDATSIAARDRLIARATQASATEVTPLFTAPTAQLIPFGDSTPVIANALRPISGKLVYADPRGDNNTLEIVTLNLDTWVETQLTDDANADNSYPSPAPDGRTIAFHSNRDGDFEIYTISITDGNVRQLTDNDVDDFIPGWSPDGEWIVYASDSNNDERYEIRRVNIANPALDEVVVSNGQRNNHARYSPDGRYLVFTTGIDPRDARTWEIALYDFETDTIVQLTRNENRDASASFSPDGSQIIFSTFNAATESNAIAVMDHDGSNQRIVLDTDDEDWSATYSPDGRLIVFTSNVTNIDQLYLMTAEGGSPQQITNTGGLFASWLPE